MSKTQDTVRTRAAIGGREITLDDPIRTFTIPLEVRVVESTIPAGFQIAWIDGDDGEGTEVSLSAGAGCGSQWGTAGVTTPDGETVRMVWNGATLLEQIAEEVRRDDVEEG